jgi:hypothetical protein
MSQVTTIQELRRIADSLERLKGRVVEDVVVRADRKQLKVKLSDGETLLVSMVVEDDGTARLDVDVFRADAVDISQLEVRFEGTPKG